MSLAEYRPRMSDTEDAGTCSFCSAERVFTRMEWLEFRQWTDRGYVFCKVLIPIGTCAGCGTKTWNEAAEAAIDRAVRKEYDKLP
jgi:hypothetical protein